MEAKVVQVGDGLGIVLPEDALSKLNVTEGDTVQLARTSEGYVISSNGPNVSGQMEEAREIMKKRRAVLRELAK